MNYADNETYRRIHFAVMAIESGARKLGISGKEWCTNSSQSGLNSLLKIADLLDVAIKELIIR